MIGNHNTFSYLPCMKWWMKLLSPWHRCQSKSDLCAENCNYFDVRVTWYNKHWCFCHNKMIYKATDVVRLITSRIQLSSYLNEPIYIRLILDIRKKPRNSKEIIYEFNNLIEMLKSNYYISQHPEALDEIRIFWDWQHPIKESAFNIIEDHVSVKGKWWEYLLGTKYYAKKHNNVYQSKEYIDDKNNVYLIDYTDICNEYVN